MPTLESFNDTAIAFENKSNKELKKAQFLFSIMSSQNATWMGMGLAKLTLKFNLPFKGLIKKTIYSQFCGGENLEEIKETTQKYADYHLDFCLDYGIEGATHEEDFDRAVEEFHKTIEFASSQNNIPFIPLKVTGFTTHHILEKVSSGVDLSDEENDDWKKLVSRIDQICASAHSKNLMILIDAEESWIQKAVDDLTDDMMEKYNREKVCVFNTFQIYRHDRLEFIKSSLSRAIEKGYHLGVKIVRGAYMEKERERALEKGYISPIQVDKKATDDDYNKAIDYCFEHLENLAVFIGTHNEESCLRAVSIMDKMGLEHDDPRVYFSQLYGMSDNITFNLAKNNYNVSKYLPYGPIKDVIPYLMRRAQENTSVAGQTGRELFLINKELERRKKENA